VALRGDLKSLNLGNVLQDLAYNSQTGTLRLHVGDRRRFLWFEKGALRLVGLGGGQGPSILNGLLAMGKVKPADLANASKRSGEPAKINKLIKERAVTNDDVKAALQGQMTELVCDTFLWSDAEFEFVRGEAKEEDFDVRQLDWEPTIACDAVTMEALRRVDEWTEIKKSVISSEEILVAVVPQLPETADATSQRLFGLLDGEKRLQDIMNETFLGQFAAFRAAAALMRGGWARPLDVREAQAKAEAHAAGGRNNEALRLARFALTHERHSPALRKLAGRCLELLGKNEEAAGEYRMLLAEETEHGKTAEAIATCRKIISLAPKDTFTQERLFQLLIDTGTPEEALAQGEALARALKKAGMPDRARSVYERLLTKFEDSEKILESLAEIAHHMGDKREAVTLYRKLFDRAVAESDEELILERSRMLLRLDPSLDDVARKRIEVETGMYAKNKRRKRKVRLILAGCLVLAVLAALGAIEWSARGRLRILQAEELDLVKQGKFAEAVGRYNGFLERYKWTLVSGEAREKRDQLEDVLVREKLPEAEEKDAKGRTDEALRIVEGVLKVARGPVAIAKAEELKRRLDEHRAKIEDEYKEEARKIAKAVAAGDSGAVDRIKKLSHALALPALKQLLLDSSPVVRRAAVSCLGEMGSHETREILVRALAEEEEGSGLRGEIEELLKKQAGKDCGPRPQDWESWVLRSGERPVQGLVGAAAPGELEWRIVNLGTKTRELELPEGFGPSFKVTGKGGAELKPGKGAVRGADKARVVRLRPGEFVGGRVALGDLVDLASMAEGPVRVGWSARLREVGGDEWELAALPTRVEVRK